MLRCDGDDTLEILVHPQIITVEQQYSLYDRCFGSRYIDQCHAHIGDEPVVSVIHLHNLFGVGYELQVGIQPVVRNDGVRQVIIRVELFFIGKYDSSADIENTDVRPA